MTDRSEFESTPAETLTRWWPPGICPPTRTGKILEARRQRRSLAIAILLFLLTLISTLAVGAQYASSYASGQSPDFDELFSDVCGACWRIHNSCSPASLSRSR